MSPSRCSRVLFLALLFAVLSSGCGGSGGNPPPPPPPAFSIATSSLPDGTRAVVYSQTLSATGGTAPLTWTLTAGVLPAGMTFTSGGVLFGTPTATGTASLTFQVRDSSAVPQTATRSLALNVVAGTLAITSTAFPMGTVNVAYSVTPGVLGGSPPYTWSVQSGALPGGLGLNTSTGEISGTPTVVNNFNFTLQVADSGSATAQRALSVSIVATQVRNDDTTNATTLSNGTFRASISPIDNPAGTVAPDVDAYRITAAANAIVTVEITAERPPIGSPLDSVIEMVNSSGTRLATCRDTTIGSFTLACMNDDNAAAFTVDSRLEFQVPAGGLTFFVRVLDFSGGGRPDMIYTITVSGAN